MDGNEYPGGQPAWASHYSQLVTRYDHDRQAMWYYMNPAPRPCFTLQLLADITRFHSDVSNWLTPRSGSRSAPIFGGLHYVVMASRVPDIFSLGGDLALFVDLIRNRNRDGLLGYARACIDPLYAIWRNLNLPVTTISLVQGTALGGGFEAALCNTVVIAERSAQLGLPEILFNLFPGMGAYHLLAWRVGPATAEKMIKSGRRYGAEELYEMGVVDELAADGEGELAVAAYIEKQNASRVGSLAIHKVRHMIYPIRYDDLIDVAGLWVDAALALSERDLRMMERLARSQSRLIAQVCNISERAAVTSGTGVPSRPRALS